MVDLSKIQTKFFFVFFPFFLELWETNSFRYTFYFFFLVPNFQPKLFKTQIGDPNPNYVICISSVKYKQKMQNKTKKTKAEILLFFSFRLILALMEMCSRSSWLSLILLFFSSKFFERIFFYFGTCFYVWKCPIFYESWQQGQTIFGGFQGQFQRVLLKRLYLQFS